MRNDKLRAINPSRIVFSVLFFCLSLSFCKSLFLVPFSSFCLSVFLFGLFGVVLSLCDSLFHFLFSFPFLSSSGCSLSLFVFRNLSFAWFVLCFRQHSLLFLALGPLHVLEVVVLFSLICFFSFVFDLVLVVAFCCYLCSKFCLPIYGFTNFQKVGSRKGM